MFTLILKLLSEQRSRSVCFELLTATIEFPMKFKTERSSKQLFNSTLELSEIEINFQCTLDNIVKHNFEN